MEAAIPQRAVPPAIGMSPAEQVGMVDPVTGRDDITGLLSTEVGMTVPGGHPAPVRTGEVGLSQATMNAFEPGRLTQQEQRTNDTIENRAQILESEATPPPPVNPNPGSTDTSALNIPSGQLAQARKLQVDMAAAAGRDTGAGTGLNLPIVADGNVPFGLTAFDNGSLLALWQQPGSNLRTVVAELMPNMNLDAMIEDPTLAMSAIRQTLDTGLVQVFVSKAPVTTANNAMWTQAAWRPGQDGIGMNPSIAPVFTADFDGDTMSAVFATARPETQQRTILDYLIGADGNTLLDMSFFGIRPWGDQAGPVLQTALGMPRADANRLAKGINNAHADDGRELMSTIRTLSNGNDQAALTMLNEIYQMNQAITAASVDYAMEYHYPGRTREETMQQMIERQVPDARALVEATLPASIIDHMSARGVPLTSLLTRNHTFRELGNVGKTSKREFDRDLNNTINEILSVHMTTMESDLKASANQMLTNAYANVAKGAGVPSALRTPEELNAWIDTLIAAWDKNQFIIERARRETMLDGTLGLNNPTMKSIGDLKGAKRLEAVATAIRSCYGSIAAEDFFGPNIVPADARGRLLGEWMTNNRSPEARGGIDSIGGWSIQPRDMRGNTGGLVNLLRDYRTVSSVRYNNAMTQAHKALMSGNQTHINKLIRANGHEQFNPEIMKAFQAIFETYPEMWMHHGITSPRTLYDNPIGRRYAEAKSANELGGIFVELVTSYYTAPLEQARAQITQASTGTQQNELDLAINMQLDKLASSSDSWRAIVADIRDGGTFLQDTLLASKPLQQKLKEINQLQKDAPGGFKFQRQDQVPLEIVSTPSGLYTGNRFLQEFGQGDHVRNMNNSANTSAQNIRETFADIQAEVQQAVKTLGPGAYSSALQAIARNPQLRTELPRELMADAITAAMEPSQAVTEKAKQTNTNATIYNAVNNMVNGIQLPDHTVAGDWSMGRISLDQFNQWPMLRTMLLADPSKSVRVYSKDAPLGTLVNRDVLLGTSSPTKADMDRFCIENPRFAMGLRKTATMGTGNNKTSSYQIATSDLASSIKQYGQARNTPEGQHELAVNLLASHPCFYALIPLTMTTAGHKRGQLRQPVSEQIDMVVDSLRYIASKPDPQAYVTTLVNRGVAESNLSQYLGNRELNYNAQGELVNYTDVLSDYYGLVGPQGIVDNLITTVGQYAGKLKTEGLAVPGRPERMINFDFAERAGAVHYLTLISELGGSGTSSRIGINANVLKDTGGLARLGQQYDQQRCEAANDISTMQPVQPAELAANLQDFIGRQTQDGTIIRQDTIPQDLAVDGVIMLQSPAHCNTPSGLPCVAHGVHDPTTNQLKGQETSLGRFISQNVGHAAEPLTLQALKNAYDGRDAIVKSDYWSQPDWNTVELRIQQDFAQNGDITQARTTLANHLAQSYRNIDDTYDGILSISSYVNVAQSLIRVVDGELIILSPGQLDALAQNGVMQAQGQARTTPLNAQEVHDAAVAGMTSIPDAQLSLRTITSSSNVNAEQRYRTNIISSHQSNPSRNYQLIKRIVQSGDGIPMSHGDIVARATELSRLNPGILKGNKDLLGSMGKKGLQNDYAYNLLGVIGGQGPSPSPVPAPDSMWVVAPNATAAQVELALTEGFAAGVNILIPTRTDAVESALRNTGLTQQLNPLSSDRWMLPSFDLQLNGKNTVGAMVEYSSGTPIMPDNAFTWSLENPIMPHAGDANAQVFPSMISNLDVGREGLQELPLNTQFTSLIINNTINGQPPNIQVNAASPAEVQRDLVDGANPAIDFGQILLPDSPVLRERQESLQRYLASRSNADQYGFLRENIRPGDTIGIIKGTYQGQVVYSPVVPFPHDKSGAAPRTFNIADYTFDRSTQQMVIVWSHPEFVPGSSFKIFDGDKPTIKLMTSGQVGEQITLANGRDVGFQYHPSSAESRRGDGVVRDSMATLWRQARQAPQNGYNVAELEGAFPNNPELLALREGRVPVEVWQQATQGGPIQVMPAGTENGAAIDLVVNHWIQQAIKAGDNPSDLLASRFGDTHTMAYPDFYRVIDSSHQHIDGTMGFFNTMDPTLVPPNSQSFNNDTFFNNNLEVFVSGLWMRGFLTPAFTNSTYSGYNAPGTSIMNRSPMAMDALLRAGITPQDNTQMMQWHGMMNPLTDVGSVLLRDDTPTGLGDTGE